MSGFELSPWAALPLLGAFHGINPGMGWLFAVALGLQERKRSAVWRSLLPLGLGHTLAIGAVVAIALLAGLAIPARPLRWLVAGMLFALGVLRLVRARHPRFGGMQASGTDLTIWSLLMATAHGAGLMVLPLVLGPAAPAHTHHAMAMGGSSPGGVAAVLAHTAGYLVATGLMAVLVYEKLGLRLLRRMWVNLDLVWAVALLLTGVLTVVW